MQARQHFTPAAAVWGPPLLPPSAIRGAIFHHGSVYRTELPTLPGTTPTTARAFADPGTGHDDDAVCDDDEDPD